MAHENISMKGLSYVPIDPAWLAESRAFHSSNPKLVRAPLLMLMHAWQAEPAGSIPADMQRMGAICGLTDIEVGEHYDALTDGWVLREGRFHHEKLADLCARMHEKFADALGRLADQAAAVVQSPEEFELTAPEMESRTKGRRLIPSNFGITPKREAWLISKGFRTVEDREFILEKFVTNAKRSNAMWNNWDAAFENFALKEDMRHLPSNGNTVVPLVGVAGFQSRASRFGSAQRGEAAVDHNQTMMAAAAGRGEAPGR
jgi:hypothetical protein